MAGISFGSPSTSLPALRRAAGGVSVGGAAPAPGGVAVFDPDASRRAAEEEGARLARETAAVTAAKQAELNAAEDRNRQIQQERDMADAHRQNAVNAGGTSSGAYGYAYPDGGGGGSSSGGSRAAAPQAAPQAASPQIDFNQLASLKAQVVPAYAQPPAAPDNGAGDLAFARAKDKAGLLALRRMSDSRAQFAQRGMTGGGNEARAMDSVLGDAAGGLTDVAIAQATQEAARGNAVSDRNFAAQIQQRGQDISLTPTLLSLLRSAGVAY